VKTSADASAVASDLRVVIGQLVRRLRAERRFPLAHAAVLGRLDREGPRGTSDLAAAEHVRPQSMAQTVGELEGVGLITRRPDPNDGRRALIELTDQGRLKLTEERLHREGWLTAAIETELSDEERESLASVVPLLVRIAESSP